MLHTRAHMHAHISQGTQRDRPVLSSSRNIRGGLGGRSRMHLTVIVLVSGAAVFNTHITYSYLLQEIQPAPVRHCAIFDTSLE